MSEIEAIYGRLIDAMIRGEAPDEADVPYAAGIAMIYAQGAGYGRKRLERRARIVEDREGRAKLVDVVMSHSYGPEGLKISLARVAKAVAVIGFEKLNAFTATCAYNIFPELQNEELKCQKRTKTGNATR